ncbi:MAG: Na+/H+ antiporter subunit A [Actinomycetota bacterium]
MLQLLVLHLVAAVMAPALVRALGRKAMLVLALAPAAVAVWVVAQTGTVAAGGAATQVVTWIPVLGLELAFRLTTLSWVMGLLVGGVGALTLAYCAFYFDDSEPGLAQFGAVFVAFAGAMFGLVTADDLLLLYVFWELTTITSYLLIGHNPESKVSRRAALQALLVTTLGGLAMLIGIIMIGESAGTYRISEVLAQPPTGAIVTAGLILLLAGALTKSALIPFHFWLPAAMAAPTPVSTYLHAAAMVKAGVYLVALLAPTFAASVPWRPVVLTLGIVTMLLGGFLALRQYDLKLLVAYGTVSQLGFLTAVLGVGTRAAALAGLAMLLAHGLFKACLFLVVGIIDHGTGTRDVRRLSGLGRRMPVLFWVSVVAAASMAGLPPLAGYVAKESVFEAFVLLVTDGEAGIGAVGSAAALAGIVLGSVLTVAYSARFLWGAFADKEGVPEPPHVHHAGWGFAAAPTVLALASVVVGLTAAGMDRLLAPYAERYAAGEETYLALWHGLTPALAMSVLAVGGGVAVFLSTAALTRRRYIPSAVDAERGYLATMRTTERVAVELTGATQRGSVRIYLGVILIVAILVTSIGGLSSGLLDESWIQQLRWWDTPAQLAVGVVVGLAAVAATRARRRLKAILLVGVSGYGAGVLFYLHGAPDLAFTQVLVETVTIVAFVLILRRMPAYFSDRPFTGERWIRVGIAAAAGVAVTVFALAASGARMRPPVSEAFPEQAYEEGGGQNVVNVTLVDIRAWDTLGEISVLVVAATGIASVIFLRSRGGRMLSRRELLDSVRTRPDHRTWLPGGKLLEPERRSVIFEVVTRLIFHVVVLYSLFLLFAGHNSPGGGFIGGLVAGLALVVRYLAGGRHELALAAPIDAGVLVGGGLVAAVGTGLVSLLAGGGMLESYQLDVQIPVLGEMHLVTSLFFDVGVYLVVVGLTLDVLRSLGAEIDRQVEASESEERVPAAADTGRAP